MRPRTLTTLLTLALLLGSAQESYGILKWIHKLSGPGPFAGAIVKCRFDVMGTEKPSLRECGFGGGVGWVADNPRRVNLALGFTNAGSLDNDLDYGSGPGVGTPTVWIAGVEPSVEWWPGKEMKHVFIETGLSINYFMVDSYDDFWKIGILGRAGYRWEFESGKISAFELGPEVSVFDSPFTPQDFGALPGHDEERYMWGVFGHFYLGRK